MMKNYYEIINFVSGGITPSEFGSLSNNQVSAMVPATISSIPTSTFVVSVPAGCQFSTSFNNGSRTPMALNSDVIIQLSS